MGMTMHAAVLVDTVRTDCHVCCVALECHTLGLSQQHCMAHHSTASLAPSPPQTPTPHTFFPHASTHLVAAAPHAYSPMTCLCSCSKRLFWSHCLLVTPFDAVLCAYRRTASRERSCCSWCLCCACMQVLLLWLWGVHVCCCASLPQGCCNCGNLLAL